MQRSGRMIPVISLSGEYTCLNKLIEEKIIMPPLDAHHFDLAAITDPARVAASSRMLEEQWTQPAILQA